MFGLMTRRAHEEIMLSKECELVHEKKQAEVLIDRIRLGEDYRARLEREIESTKKANRELVHTIDGMQSVIDDKEARIERLNFQIREKELMLGSYEARYRMSEDLEKAERSSECERRSFVPPTKDYPPMPVPEIDEEPICTTASPASRGIYKEMSA